MRNWIKAIRSAYYAARYAYRHMRRVQRRRAQINSPF